MISISFDSADVQSKLNGLSDKLDKPRSLFMAIAGALESETMQNFEAQGRPSWVPLQATTVAARTKNERRSKFVGPKKPGSVLSILQESGLLASSISTDYGDDFAMVGANTPYAAIHQFGGTINRQPYSTKVRLRTDAKGNLLRQGADGKLAVFAKQKGSDAHKRYRESEHKVDAFSIKIPDRPYLPFKGSADAAILQPETERTILDLVNKMLSESLS